VYNGIDPGDYPWLLPRADVPADGGRLLFLGRLAGWKGADVLLRAVRRLVERRPRLTLTIAGHGPALEEWKEETFRLSLSETVRFAGFVADVVPLLHEADVLVHTSTEPEPFGRVLVEGMAAGVPVVASSLGAAPEILEDGISGFLSPPRDVNRLAERIEEVLAAGPARLDVSRRARERVEAKFSADEMVRGVAEILNRLDVPSPGTENRK
jgi:glycosyltransferase involved in cell wall biosynthesis